MPCRNLIACLPLVCLTGCSWLPYAIENVQSTTAKVFAEHRFKNQSRDLAELAWLEACHEAAPHQQNPDGEYHRGFVDGFMDFLSANGTGEPPGTLPLHLRSPILRTSKEQQDIYDWVAGFRHGSSVAARDQWRNRIVVPIPLPPVLNEERYGEEYQRRFGPQSDRRGGTPAVATFGDSSELPPPRRATSDAKTPAADKAPAADEAPAAAPAVPLPPKADAPAPIAPPVQNPDDGKLPQAPRGDGASTEIAPVIPPPAPSTGPALMPRDAPPRLAPVGPLPPKSDDPAAPVLE